MESYQRGQKHLRITIKDIAERAGVSKTTVSFALNNPSRISTETYERIMAIVAELGYVPDPVARNLATKRLGALGLLLPQPLPEALANPYLCELLRGIGEVCEERGLALTMLPPIKGKIEEAARRAAVDALLTIGVGPGTAVADILERRRLPFVTIDGSESDSTLNVGIDDEAAAYALMEHLLGLGHRRIAVLELMSESYPSPEECFSPVRDRRLAGFRRALGAFELELGSEAVPVLRAEGSLEGGARATEALFSASARLPTAIVAMADVVALGVYEAAARLGLSIPGELSVAGFDDIPFAALASPPLTTIRQPGYQKGATAAGLALALLEEGRAAHCILPAELIRRGSTAAPKEFLRGPGGGGSLGTTY